MRFKAFPIISLICFLSLASWGTSVNKPLTLTVSGSSLNVSLTVQEALPNAAVGVSRVNEPVTVGIPVADSVNVKDVTQLASSSGLCQFRALAYWPSGNAKWVQSDFVSSVPANGAASASITNGTCSGAGMASDNGSTITVDTSAAIFTIQKANFDLLHRVVISGQMLAHGTDGMVLMGPAFGASTCTLATNCTTKYSSAQDSASSCVIEQNGPVHSAIKCWGGLKDASGNKYMGFQIRLHFYKGKTRAEVVPVLKNADDGAVNTFPISYKGYGSLELRLGTDFSSGSGNFWTFANETTTPVTGDFSSGPTAYLYSGYQNSFFDSQYNQNVATGIRNSASDVPRNNSGSSFTYGQDGYLLVKPDSSTAVGDHSKNPGGWADVRDKISGAGIEFGVPWMAAVFPKSLEIRSSGQEIRIGLSPDQTLWKVACPASVTPCQKIYYQPWPAYKVSNAFFDFHSADLGSELPNELKRVQYPLIARASVDQYNQSGAMPYPMLTAAEEDSYFSTLRNHTLTPRYNVSSYSVLPDITPVARRWWGRAVGGGGNQFDDRYDNLMRWIARGYTGRYLDTVFWARFDEQFGWPRADGFHWLDHVPQSDLNTYDGYPSRCWKDNGCNDNSGMTPANFTMGYQNLVGTMENDWSHPHSWYSAYLYYMTGDEEIGDLWRTSVVTAFRDPTRWNNLGWQNTGTNNPLNNARATGGHLRVAAALLEFLTSTQNNRTDFATSVIAADIAGVNQSIDNNLTLLFREPCTVIGFGTSQTTMPAGCSVVYDGSAIRQESRGLSPYRGFFYGANDANDQSHAQPLSQFPTAYAWPGSGSVWVRSIEPFMQGLFIDGPYSVLKVRGPSWSGYNRLFDALYGVALNADRDLYDDFSKVVFPLPAGYNIGAVPPSYAGPAPTSSPGQLVYTTAADQPNDRAVWYINNDGAGHDYGVWDSYGNGPPYQNLYGAMAAYLGYLPDSARTHWEDTFISRGDYTYDLGGHIDAQIVYTILHPAAAKQQNVTLDSATYNGDGTWTLTWHAPAGVTQYLLKFHPTKTLVDNVGWDVTTNQPLQDLATHYNWFGMDAQYTSVQPSTSATSITVTAPSTASFMLKAYVKH